MKRRILPLAIAALVLCAAPARADDALIDLGSSLVWMHVSTSKAAGETLPMVGATGRFLWLDGRGEVGMGAKITGYKTGWGDDTDNVGFDLKYTAQFSGRWKGNKVHILPCGGFAIGLRQLFLDTREGTHGMSYAISGIGIDLHLGLHGYFGDDSGFYWRLTGILEGHLLFPNPGWTGGGGLELTVGIYLD